MVVFPWQRNVFVIISSIQFPFAEVAVSNDRLIGYLFTLGEVAQVCFKPSPLITKLTIFMSCFLPLLSSYAPPTPQRMYATLCRVYCWPVLNVKVCMAMYLVLIEHTTLLCIVLVFHWVSLFRVQQFQVFRPQSFLAHCKLSLCIASADSHLL